MKIGAHMSTGGGPAKALDRALSVGAEICQIFVKNNMQWLGKPCPPEELRKFQMARAAGALSSVFGHTGYLINLAAPASPNRARSIESLLQEIQFAGDLQLPFLVLHPGAHLGTGEDKGLDQVTQALNEVIRATKGSSVRIALENTAGQGSCLGASIQHLAALFEKTEFPERLGICLDTAHLFAAGHDIRSEKGWDTVLGDVDRLIGLDKVLSFHLNDSKTDLGSRVDRHEHIGEGKIGLEAFRIILADDRFANHPGCLETPKSDDLHEDIKNLKVLRSLQSGAEPLAVPPKRSADRRQATKRNTAPKRGKRPDRE